MIKIITTTGVISENGNFIYFTHDIFVFVPKSGHILI